MASVEQVRKVFREELEKAGLTSQSLQNEVLVIGDRLEVALARKIDEVLSAINKQDKTPWQSERTTPASLHRPTRRSAVVKDDVPRMTTLTSASCSPAPRLSTFMFRRSHNFDNKLSINSSGEKVYRLGLRNTHIAMDEDEDDDMERRPSSSRESSTKFSQGGGIWSENRRPTEKVTQISPHDSFEEIYMDIGSPGYTPLVNEPTDFTDDGRDNACEDEPVRHNRRGPADRLSTQLFANFRDTAAKERPSDCLAELVYSDEFNFATSILVCLNAISIGLQADYMARYWSEDAPILYRISDLVFCSIFVIELLLRFYAFGRRFFVAPGWQWNVFDAVVVGFQVIDEVMEEACRFQLLQSIPHFVSANDVSILRIIRIFRVIRIFRLARVLHLFGELRRLLVSIADSVRSLCWIVFLFILLVYVLGVYLTQVVTDHKVRVRAQGGSLESLEDLQTFYGSVDTSMLTLYETITEGIHWHDVMEPLVAEVSPWIKLIFCFYSAFIFFAVLNIVTAAFVDNAIKTGDEDRKKLLMYQMRQLFQEADADGSGTISREEFQAQLANPQMLDYLKAIDLDKEEALDLFNLLDIDGHEEIDADDLAVGCLRLHGPAKSIDLATFMREYERQSHIWNSHARGMEEGMSVILDEIRMMIPNDELKASTYTKSVAVSEMLAANREEMKSVTFNHC